MYENARLKLICSDFQLQHMNPDEHVGDFLIDSTLCYRYEKTRAL